MQQRLARGEEAALGELYDRFAALVHSQAQRILDDDTAADHVTREVFGYMWENPDAYDPRQGPMRAWVARLAHRHAVRRLRETGTGGADGAEFEELDALEERVSRATAAARADYIVESMPAPLWAALELAYVQRRDYRQAAADLGVTEDEARRRLRLGLQLLSSAHARPSDGASPPGYGSSR